MTFDFIKPAALTVLLGTTPFLTYAGVTVGESIGTTEDEIRAALEAQGAEILEIEREDDEIEVEYREGGQTFEIEISLETGMVVEAELEEDDDDDDDDYDDDEDDDGDDD